MPYRDPAKNAECRRRYAERKRRERQLEKYGDNSDHRGQHGNHKKGPDHPRWSDSGRFIFKGYVFVRVGYNHPLETGGGYAPEHYIIWASAGRPMPAPGEELHHINEVKTDNRLENLEVQSKADHARHHIKKRQRNEAGQLLPGGKL